MTLLASKALIKKGDSFLIILDTDKNGQQVWDLPGGKIELGETPEQTVKREVFEEVNLSVKVSKSVGNYTFNSIKGEILCEVFICKPENFNIDLTKNPANEEILDYKFVTREEFLKEKYFVFDKSLKNLIRTL